MRKQFLAAALAMTASAALAQMHTSPNAQPSPTQPGMTSPAQEGMAPAGTMGQGMMGTMGEGMRQSGTVATPSAGMDIYPVCTRTVRDRCRQPEGRSIPAPA